MGCATSSPAAEDREKRYTARDLSAEDRVSAPVVAAVETAHAPPKDSQQAQHQHQQEQLKHQGLQQKAEPVPKQEPVVSKLRTDCKVRDVYKLGKIIGTGGFSVVRTAIEKATDIEYACKVMSLPRIIPTGVVGDSEMISDAYKDVNMPCENSREDIYQEIDILCGLNHENVLFLKEYFDEDNKVYLITEILRGGELLDAVLQRGTYNESEARSCFQQLLRGIEYLHSRGVVHRDLKLENLLLTNKDDITAVKIADFGLAKMTDGEAMETICGTPQYVAPEVIQGLKITQYGPGVDIWGAGIVLFILLGGYPPFYSECEPTLFNLIRRGHFTFEDPVWEGISSGAKDLITKLLVVDPEQRLTAAAALKHPWLSDAQICRTGSSLTGTQMNLKKHFSNRSPSR